MTEDALLDRYGGTPAAEPRHDGLVQMVHRGLRGRYHLALACGIVLAVVGAITPFSFVKPVYTAEGLVRVAPTTRKILYAQDENQIPPMYDTFVATEAAYIESPRVIERASTDPQLTSAGWPLGPSGISALSRQLSVSRRMGNQLIRVRVEDEEAVRAQRAVNAVLEAYKEIYADQQLFDVADRQEQLTRRQTELQRQLEDRRDHIRALSARFGTRDLKLLHDAKLGQLLKVSEQIDQYPPMLAGDDSVSEEEETLLPMFMGDTGLAIEYLSTHDDELARLVAEARQVTSLQLDVEARYGASHPSIKELAARQERLQEQISNRILVLEDLFRQSWFASMVRKQYNLGPEEAVDQREHLTALHDQIAAELGTITDTMLKIESHEEQALSIVELQRETTRALEQLRAERPYIDEGRISIAQAAVPLKPSADRRLRLAAMGAAVGFTTPFMLFWLVSIVRPALRYVDDLDHAGFSEPVLGTLPDLRQTDAEHAEIATMSVHNIRNMLRLTGTTSDQEGVVYAITSATPGDGKTSLAVALGASFATERLNTLIVDTDLAGCGLTRAFQCSGARGFTEAAATGDVFDAVKRTDLPSLYVLPAGDLDLRRPEQLSLHEIRAFLDSLRAAFDIILIDTGPVMGSLEANLIIPLADQAILAVSRGQDPRLTNETLDRIRRIGGNCAGIVFNRALHVDVRTSSQRSSTAGSNGIHVPPSAGDTDAEIGAGSNGSDHRSNGHVRVVNDEGPTVLVSSMLNGGHTSTRRNSERQNSQ